MADTPLFIVIISGWWNYELFFFPFCVFNSIFWKEHALILKNKIVIFNCLICDSFSDAYILISNIQLGEIRIYNINKTSAISFLLLHWFPEMIII